jgi:hypothetical protein
MLLAGIQAELDPRLRHSGVTRSWESHLRYQSQFSKEDTKDAKIGYGDVVELKKIFFFFVPPSACARGMLRVLRGYIRVSFVAT